MALLRDPGEQGLPETIYDDLSSSYNVAVEGGVAALNTSDAAHSAAAAELVGEIARLKALNFDLLMAAGTETSEPKVESTNESDEPSIDSLFDKE